jgi:hypothetical protein
VLIKQPQYRKRLSQSQLKLLALICKFRFVTVPLLSEWQNKDKSTVYERLDVLTEQDYLHKTYERKWRLLGKPAVYSLAAKGIKALRNNTEYFCEAVYKNQYKNKSASIEFIDHSVDIAWLCSELRKQYGNSFDIFSKAEITRFDEFIRPLPDAYLRGQTKTDGNKRHYQLEIIEPDTLTWIIRKRITAHQEWYDDNSYEEWALEVYPTLLLFCDNQNTEKRIHRLTDDMYGDFDVLTTTRERFGSGKKKIWLHIYDENEAMELVAL